MTALSVSHVPQGVGEAFTGELTLDVQARAGRSVVVRQGHSGALRVLRPHYPDTSGQVSVIAINPGGGYLGGDSYRLSASMTAGAALQLTTQSATKVYRTPQGPVSARQEFVLEDGARLESVPDGLIAYEGASYRQDTVVRMSSAASLALAETVTHGWSPDGTPFAFDEVSLRTEIHVDGRLAVLDNLLLRPGQDGVGPLMLGGASHLGTLLVVDSRATTAAVEELRAELGITGRSGTTGAVSALSLLAVPGFALRSVGGSTQMVEAVLQGALNWMRRQWHGQQPLDLRKY
ncbi:urease accessory protein UreD [Arthrobacter sp. NPDC090010]|uniref:urease accessory protein UreD n=1 Tax=Arthrobacter sp. NPDC090010 TaxID=3363942 RepID=UPI00380D7B4E